MAETASTTRTRKRLSQLFGAARYSHVREVRSARGNLVCTVGQRLTVVDPVENYLRVLDFVPDEIDTLEESLCVKILHTASPKSVVVSEDGKFAAILYRDAVLILDLALYRLQHRKSSEPKQCLISNKETVIEAKFHPLSSNFIALLHGDGRIRIYDFKTDFDVPCVTVSPDEGRSRFQPASYAHGRSIASFDFGRAFAWDALSIFMLHENGTISLASPIVPPGLEIPDNIASACTILDAGAFNSLTDPRGSQYHLAAFEVWDKGLESGSQILVLQHSPLVMAALDQEGSVSVLVGLQLIRPPREAGALLRAFTVSRVLLPVRDASLLADPLAADCNRLFVASSQGVWSLALPWLPQLRVDLASPRFSEASFPSTRAGAMESVVEQVLVSHSLGEARGVAPFAGVAVVFPYRLRSSHVLTVTDDLSQVTLTPAPLLVQYALAWPAPRDDGALGHSARSVRQLLQPTFLGDVERSAAAIKQLPTFLAPSSATEADVVVVRKRTEDLQAQYIRQIAKYNELVQQLHAHKRNQLAAIAIEHDALRALDGTVLRLRGRLRECAHRHSKLHNDFAELREWLEAAASHVRSQHPLSTEEEAVFASLRQTERESSVLAERADAISAKAADLCTRDGSRAGNFSVRVKPLSEESKARLREKLDRLRAFVADAEKHRDTLLKSS